MARQNVPSQRRSSPQSPSQTHSSSSGSSRVSQQYSGRPRQPTTSLRSHSPSLSLDGTQLRQFEDYTDMQMVRDLGRVFEDAANYRRSEGHKGEGLADGAERPKKKK